MQSVARLVNCRSRYRKFESKLSHTTFVELYHEIIPTVILHTPLIHEGQLSVSGESVYTSAAYVCPGKRVSRLT